METQKTTHKYLAFVSYASYRLENIMTEGGEFITPFEFDSFDKAVHWLANFLAYQKYLNHEIDYYSIKQSLLIIGNYEYQGEVYSVIKI